MLKTCRISSSETSPSSWIRPKIGGAGSGGAMLPEFGVPPASIPDYLALVGDSADGLPGIPGWGAKSSAVILSRSPSRRTLPCNR